jgi:anti-sigma B factor antagonist
LAHTIFTGRSAQDASTVTVSVTGEIDFATADTLGEHLRAAIDTVPAGTGTVLVDLSAVTFLDSAGINRLLRGRRLADQHGKHYRVVGADGIVRQVLEITGAWKHLTDHAD